MSSEYDFTEPDEERPAKRTRLDGSLNITEETAAEMADEDDWDDVYGADGAQHDVTMVEKQAHDSNMPDVDVQPATSSFQPPVAHSDREINEGQQSLTQNAETNPAKADSADAAQGEELVAPGPSIASTDVESAKVIEEVAEVEMPSVDGLPTSANIKSLEPMQEDTVSGARQEEQSTEMVDSAGTAEAGPSAPKKAAEDPEFLAAAEAQKDNKDAEWRFDSSDAESSSDSDSSDSSDDDSDDSGSEGGYELLDPVTAARMLMSGDGDDEDGGAGRGKNDYQPRTANEKQEEVVPKPDVVVTPEMKITLLGHVERMVDNLILIKGATPGEYQVLEGGSVLCTEDRNVIGSVAETLGRVQEPLYSVMFTNAKEIEDAGLTFGTNIYYVDSRSTFVFTQPLKNLKGTDASNIHDEEVGDDEIEFSDDEVEAEYKRQKKLAKKSGRGALSRGDFNDGVRISQASGNDGGPSYSRGNDAPAQNYGGGMSYDDDETAEEFYMPLKRPDNLSQLMSGPSSGHQQPNFDRGRGRGGFRGRGRGDRGRGRGGADFRNQRGGRGGQHNSTQSHRGNAQSFPDRHNSSNDAPRHERHSLPPRPSDRAPTNPNVSSYNPQYQPQQPQQPQQQYQFNGYTFQYGNHAGPPAATQAYGAPASQPPAIPPGSYLNPAFAQAAQYQQQQYPQQQYAQQQYSQQQYPQQPPPPSYLTQQQQHWQNQYTQPSQVQPPPPPTQQHPAQSFSPDISEILKNLGAQR